jgi:hypothetical protein
VSAFIRLKRIYRRFYWLPKDLEWRWRLRGIKELVCFGICGIGDDLLCTAVLREMYQRGRRRVAMMTNWPELFENLPYPAKLIPYDVGALHCIARAGITVRQVSYSRTVQQDPLKLEFQPGHFIEAMCRSVGISGPVVISPEAVLRPEEVSKWAHLRDSVAVQTSRANPRHAMPNKEWLAANWPVLAGELRGVARFVQVGGPDDPIFPGAEDLRGKTSLRDLMAVLANARLFVGMEGFLMHLAKAVKTKSVIIYGGYIHPSHSGYAENINLFTELPCSPCGFPSHCDFERMCMTMITPKMVAEAVRRALQAESGAVVVVGNK